MNRYFLNSRTWLTGLIRAIIRPRPRTRLWKWLDGDVVIPESIGGPEFNFEVQHWLATKEAFIGCFVAMSFAGFLMR